MKLKELEPLIGRALEARLEGFKYLSSKGKLHRKTDSGWQTIFVGPQTSSVAGMVKLAAFGHVRIEAIELLITPYVPSLKANPNQAMKHATVVFNCDNIITEKALIHEFSTVQERLTSFVEAYAKALKIDVIPLMDKLSKEDLLYELLIDPAPRTWITDSIRRFSALLAILVRRNDKVMFDKISTDFIAFCSQRHTQHERPVAESIIAGLNEAWIGKLLH